MENNIIVQVGRTLIRPWKEDVDWKTALLVFGIFAILVWWATDALLVHGKLLRAAQDLVSELEGIGK